VELGDFLRILKKLKTVRYVNCHKERRAILRRKKKLADSSMVERRPLTPDVEGSNPSPPAN
jgi:hypothetical protein